MGQVEVFAKVHWASCGGIAASPLVLRRSFFAVARKIQNTMSESNQPTQPPNPDGTQAKEAAKPKRVLKYLICREPGHRRDKCPQNPDAEKWAPSASVHIVIHPVPQGNVRMPQQLPYVSNETCGGIQLNYRTAQQDTAAPSTPLQPTTGLMTAMSPTRMLQNNNVLYFVFDLKTTGLNRNNCDIIKIAMAVVNNNKKQIGDEVFHQLVRPTARMEPGAECTHGIMAAELANKPLFDVVGRGLIEFIEKYLRDNTKMGILTAHNGHAFDVPVCWNFSVFGIR